MSDHDPDTFEAGDITLHRLRDYVWEIPREGEMRVPARVLASEALLEEIAGDKTLQQLKNTTHLPGIQQHALCMPDGHQGYGFPVGGVAGIDTENGCISPGAVGYDINCLTGDSAVELAFGRRLPIRDLADRFEDERAFVATEGGIESPLRLFTESEAKTVYEVETETGDTVRATGDHPFDTPGGHTKPWIWVFAASFFTVFKIFGSRSTDALREVLGKDCAAMIGADFYSAYKCFMKEANIKVQFCWAHLIRDIKFLSESSDKVTANYGNRLLELCREIFRLQHRREQLGETVFRRRMERLKESFLATGRRSRASGAQDLVKRLTRYGQEYFLFLEHPQVEPTNNLAEREVRHCVIDRRITQGTRGHAGQRWCERVWTVLATCARQHRDAFAFIVESVSTFYAGQPQPSLLPDD